MNLTTMPNTGAPDQDIARRIAQITSENTPLMQQARTTGLQQANQRGLSNSSMAVGASQAEAYRVAAPIASQEAGIAASARDQQSAALTTLSAQRMNAIAAMLQNPDIPADARTAALRSFEDQYQQQVNYLQNLYGARFNPSSPASGGGGSAPMPFTPFTPFTPFNPSAPPISVSSPAYTFPAQPIFNGGPMPPQASSVVPGRPATSVDTRPGGGFGNQVANIASQVRGLAA